MIKKKTKKNINPNTMIYDVYPTSKPNHYFRNIKVRSKMIMNGK
jgi:hypothetical protein